MEVVLSGSKGEDFAERGEELNASMEPEVFLRRVGNEGESLA